MIRNLPKGLRLRMVTFSTGIIAILLCVLSYSNVFSQDVGEGCTGCAGGGGSCYSLVTLECGLGLGQWTYCNFSGVYGPPTSCTGVDCYGTFRSRVCVQGS
jgi:hypothetical protein